MTRVVGSFTCILIFLYACGPNHSESTLLETRKVDSLSTDALMPASFIFSSKAIPLDGGLVYWDSSVKKLIVLDENRKLKKALVSEMGEGPESLTFFGGFNVTSKYIFVFGAKCLVYDRNSLSFVGKYALPNADINWIREFNGALAIGGLKYDENKYMVLSLRFSPETGFTEINERVVVEFPERLDELSKVTEAEVLGQYLFILKTHTGELMKLDESFHKIFDKPLPFRFEQATNLTKYSDGELDLEHLESWSLTSSKKRLLVLRDQDMSEPTAPRNRTHRNTIHILDMDGIFLGKIRLKEKSVHISALDSLLYAINPLTEKYMVYEILD